MEKPNEEGTLGIDGIADLLRGVPARSLLDEVNDELRAMASADADECKHILARMFRTLLPALEATAVRNDDERALAILRAMHESAAVALHEPAAAEAACVFPIVGHGMVLKGCASGNLPLTLAYLSGMLLTVWQTHQADADALAMFVAFVDLAQKCTETNRSGADWMAQSLQSTTNADFPTKRLLQALDGAQLGVSNKPYLPYRRILERALYRNEPEKVRRIVDAVLPLIDSPDWAVRELREAVERISSADHEVGKFRRWLVDAYPLAASITLIVRYDNVVQVEIVRKQRPVEAAMELDGWLSMVQKEVKPLTVKTEHWLSCAHRRPWKVLGKVTALDADGNEAGSFGFGSCA